MAIAVACDGLTIAPAFVTCSSYMCYDVSTGSPMNCRNIPAADQPLQNLPIFLDSIGADVLICGQIDREVAALVEAHGVEVVSGRRGDPLTAVEDYLDE